jgi:hypothetical protein
MLCPRQWPPLTMPITAAFRKAVFDRDVLPLDIAGFVHTAVKCHESFHHRVARRTNQNSDCRHRRLLRARRERPRRRRATEQRDEVAASPQLADIVQRG